VQHHRWQLLLLDAPVLDDYAVADAVPAAVRVAAAAVAPCVLTRPAAAVQVAAAVGIPAEDVHAGIKPAGKAALVEKLKAQVRAARA
jgi:Cu+-exporting ATPase